jgi:chromosomal replication initiation ATPase DnaA
MTTKVREIENLFSAISDTLNEVGLVQTISILKKGSQGILWKSDLSLASKAVCEAYDIASEVLFGKNRKYPRKYAFACWVYICYEDLNYGLSDLSAYTHRSMSTISKAKQLIEDYPQETTFDKKIHEKLARSRTILTNLLNK